MNVIKKISDNRKKKKKIKETLQKIREQIAKIDYNNLESKENKVIKILIPTEILFDIGIPEDETDTWKHGYKEGLICGYQNAVSDFLDTFLNSDLAKEFYINKIKAELSDKEKPIRSKSDPEYYVNIEWF